MSYELPFIGLLVSVLFIGLTGIYPGGIIVPGYVVLFANSPQRIAGTLIAALLTYFAYRLVSQYVILFGRRRFAFMILVGGLWTFSWLALFPRFTTLSPEFRVIGWVIPGLIANNFEKQGVWLTAGALVLVTVVSYVAGGLYFAIK